MYSIYAHGAQKRKNDSQVVSLFMLSESERAKALRKYVGEIDTWSPQLLLHVHVTFSLYLSKIDFSLFVVELFF